MKVLVLNCGSSSIKYQLLDMANDSDILAKGLLERVGLEDAELGHQPKGKDKVKRVQSVADHQVGIDLILKMLVHPEYGVLKTADEIDAVGHRVVHGGEKFSGSVEITQENY
jgi:acetate kinase